MASTCAAHAPQKKNLFSKKKEGKTECAVFIVGGLFCSKAMAGRFAAHTHTKKF